MDSAATAVNHQDGRCHRGTSTPNDGGSQFAPISV